MHVRVAAARLVDALHLRRGEYSHRDVLRDGRLARGSVAATAAATAEIVRVRVSSVRRVWRAGVVVVVVVVVVAVEIAWGRGEGAAFEGGAAGAGGVGAREDGEGEEGPGVFLGEADGGRGGGVGGAEGAVERREGDFEVDGVVGGRGLDGVVVEDGFLEK